VEVATQSIPSGGGTVVVNAPGSEIDGMEIDVPPGSYASSKTFKVTTSEITNHQLGEYFNPITPLIQIENGGGYADSVMTVTIPITLPEDHFAMAFYYDEVTGSLEGIPLLELTPTSITFATRHFMPAMDLHFNESTTKGSPLSFNASSNVLISSISESVLMGKSIISTGFKPGTDDYEFTNYGSYICPGGHCAGQSWTMMWYYYEKSLNGASALFSQFDALDNLWQDNPLYYRFASVVQREQEAGLVFKTLAKMMNDQEYHHISWKAFALSMLLTGHPQYVLLERADGRHAILAHKISMTDGILYVTDPNYPGQERQIKFVNNKFSPYNTMQNANENDPTPYTGIGYEAVTAIVEWDKITQRYAQVLDSTIGNVAPNTFPEYTIWVKDQPDKKLENNFVTDKDTFRCIVECPVATKFWIDEGKKKIQFDFFSKNGDKIGVYEGRGKSYFLLKPGLNEMGIYIYSSLDGRTYEDGSFIPYFIDFKWFKVYYSKLQIDPDPIVAEPGEEVEITARSGGTAPDNARYVWNFGDKTKEVTVKKDSTVTHRFAKEGDYTVTVELYDDDTDKLLGYVAAEANIANGILSRLKRYQYVSIDFGGDFIGNNESVTLSSLSIDNSPPWGSSLSYPIEWSGASFRVSFQYNGELFSGEKYVTNGSIQCTLSANGLKIVSLSANQLTSYPESKDVFTKNISLRDLTYDPSYTYDEYNPRFSNEGPSVSSNIVSFVTQWEFIDSDGNPFTLVSQSCDYSNPEDEPYLYVTFSGEK